MAELLIYRGLPASGKTTHARAWVEGDPTLRVRVNRDDLRWMLHGGYVYSDPDLIYPERKVLDRDAEERVTIARDKLLKVFLASGISVACDDTNLSSRYTRAVARIGWEAGAHVRFVDLTDVALDLCLLRDEQRESPIGEDVIRGMYDRYLSGGRSLVSLADMHKLYLGEGAPVSPVYVPKPGTPRAVMVDLDGTLCLHDGRSPYDESLVHTDKANPAVVAAINSMADTGYKIIFCSGRSDSCVDETLAWISEHVGEHPQFEALWMRRADDRRRDSIVKLELFDEHIRDHYDVAFVLDDRQQVVDAWREIGLSVFQVAPGDF